MDLEPFMQLISFSGWLLLDKGSFVRSCCNGTAANEVWQIKIKSPPLGATLAQLAAVTLSITVGTLQLPCCARETPKLACDLLCQPCPLL